jgi:hypothetical protein
MNTPIPLDPDTLATSTALVETLQQPMLKQGGASSSSLLNRLINRVKRDIMRSSVEVTDAADAVRVLSIAMAANNAGMGRAVASLRNQVASIVANGNPNRAIAELDTNALTLAGSSDTTADVNPMFGQATLPAVSRQNVLVVERSDGSPPSTPDEARILYVRQPYVNSTTNAQPPADFDFGEDLYSVFAMDGRDLSAWVVEDPALAGHMVWVEIQLPGDVSGSYRCNELEFVPSSMFNFDLVAVRAEIIGSGWRDIDFSYLNGYQGASNAVLGLGASRLCFAQSSVRRFRLGLWCAGPWGFQTIRVLNATYSTSATLSVDFDTVTQQPLQTVMPIGKTPSQLSYLPIQADGGRVTTTLSPTGSATETPVVTGIVSTW